MTSFDSRKSPSPDSGSCGTTTLSCKKSDIKSDEFWDWMGSIQVQAQAEAQAKAEKAAAAVEAFAERAKTRAIQAKTLEEMQAEIDKDIISAMQKTMQAQGNVWYPPNEVLPLEVTDHKPYRVLASYNLTSSNIWIPD